MLRKKTIEVRVDDLDGKTEIDNPTTTFAFNDTVYEIDLSPANVAKLQTALAPFVKAARLQRQPTLVRTSGASNRARTRKRKGPDPVKVREWAAASGVEVSTHGRIPKSVTEQYLAAKSKPAAKKSPVKATAAPRRPRKAAAAPAKDKAAGKDTGASKIAAVPDPDEAAEVA